jgi:hypothetical protein
MHDILANIRDYYNDYGGMGMVKTAIIVGDWRYELRREWDSSLPPYVIGMLNPSRADHWIDDPTVVRCVERAKRLGYGSIIVWNLFAGRSPKPAVMKKMLNPIGPANDLHIVRILTECRRRNGIAVVGWGPHGSFKNRDRRVLELAKRVGVNFHCLGTTAEGYPRHPLYVSYDQPLVKWRD